MAKMPGEFSESINLRKSVSGEPKVQWSKVNMQLQIEQFLFTKPEESWQAFDEMMAVSEDFYKSLGLPSQ